MIKRITNWLETHFCVPAYSGWVLGAIAICFLGAAINTMAGWLYVISGVSFALLSVAAVLPPRSLLGLVVKREQIQPVTAGDDLTIELEIFNPRKQSVDLLQLQDILPFVLGKPAQRAIENNSHKRQLPLGILLPYPESRCVSLAYSRIRNWCAFGIVLVSPFA